MLTSVKYPVYKPLLGGNERKYVDRCLDTGWISSKGEFVSHFETAFAKYIGCDFAMSVCNGTVALHLALEALNLGPGDEVIVPTFTYVASVNTIVQSGAVPVFVDSLAATWQTDPDDVLRKITPRTKAVLAVHLYGLPCDMERMVAICRQKDLYLVEDCAEAFGTLYKGQHVGKFGNIATFSFFGNKTITTGEGGMVVTNDVVLFHKAYHLKTQGVSPTIEYWHDTLAYNYRMTNICAAIGLAQLEQADAMLAKKRQIADWYQEGLNDLPLVFHKEVPDTKHSYWMCSFVLNAVEGRDPLRRHLKNKGIETRPLFYPAHILPHHATGQCFPVAQSLSARGISLPSYPELSIEDVNFICQTIREYFSV